MKKLMLIFVLMTFSLFGASFDCTKAKSNVEKMICQDEELSKQDEKLSTVYADFYFVSKEIKSDQKEWITQRNQCQDIACIKEAYSIRIEELNTSLSNQKTFPKTYLDAMKKAQESMQIVELKTATPLLYKAKQSKEFKEDFFRFRNITFKTPLIAEVKDYNDPKLKEILGECYGYRFDLEVIKTPHRILEPGEDMYMSPDLDPINPVIRRRPILGFNLYIWKLNAKGKEWFFIRPILDDGDYDVVDPSYCKELRYNGDIAKALNTDKESIKNSYFSRQGEANIIVYNSKEYLIAMDMSQEFSIAMNRSYDAASFRVHDILEIIENWKPIEIIGAEYVAIFFRSIDVKY
jgi:uncharacterized protein